MRSGDIGETMKTVIFDENDPKSMSELVNSVFNDEDAPKSISYRRLLIRPTIKWKNIVFCLFLWIVLITTVCFVFLSIGLRTRWIVTISVAVTLFCIIVFARQIVITFIRIYQRYAPDAIRNKCTFES